MRYFALGFVLAVLLACALPSYGGALTPAAVERIRLPDDDGRYDHIDVIQDDRRGVTCYMARGSGHGDFSISCVKAG
jgi:hypothetical protein